MYTALIKIAYYNKQFAIFLSDYCIATKDIDIIIVIYCFVSILLAPFMAVCANLASHTATIRTYVCMYSSCVYVPLRSYSQGTRSNTSRHFSTQTISFSSSSLYPPS